MKRRVAFISVVPSPYQRDLFAALADRPEIDPDVYYMEASSPDSPWPEKPLASYEKILPGFWVPIAHARIHVNWGLPSLAEYEVVVVNSLMSITAQRLMRFQLRERPWIFMGERLSSGGRAWHDQLTKPLHQAAGIAAIGTWAERDYAKRFTEPITFNLPYCCEVAPYLEQPRHKAGNDVTFLFCGQMIGRKGVDLLLKAFAQLNSGRLLLVGREAELPTLLKSVPESARSRIEYLGFQSPRDLPRYFAMADVFVLPSRYDGWGVVVNQAVAAGLPVICSNQVGAGYDLVEDSVNGLKFQAGDAHGLERSMRFLADHREFIEPWGEASRTRGRSWTPAIAAAKWVEAIGQVLQR